MVTQARRGKSKIRDFVPGGIAIDSILAFFSEDAARRFYAVVFLERENRLSKSP
jgi:hypothetical protein